MAKAGGTLTLPPGAVWDNDGLFNINAGTVNLGGSFTPENIGFVIGVMDPNFQAIDLICDVVEQSKGAAEIVSLDVIAKRARPKLAAK